MGMQVRWGRVFGAVAGLGLLWTGGQWLLAGPPSVENQLWVERLPRSDRDEVASLLFLAPEDSNQRLGAFARSSTWKRRVDLFRYGLVGQRARLVFPQDGHSVVVDLKTYACEGRAPAPFTLCLDVTAGDGRTATLYSLDDWEVTSPEGGVQMPLDDDSAPAPVPLMQLLGR